MVVLVMGEQAVMGIDAVIELPGSLLFDARALLA